MAGDATFIAAIVGALQADTGAGSLVQLTGHTLKDLRILRQAPPKAGQLPFLAVSVPVSVPLIKDQPFVKRYTVVISALCGQEALAIRIADRVEQLVNPQNQASNAYFDFSSAEVKVYSTLWKRRIRSEYDEDLDSYKDQNIIEIVANPFIGC